MKTLIVSANPLFLEATSATLSSHSQSELVTTLPSKAPELIQEIRPGVILVDKDIQADIFETILIGTQRLERTRLILLNCQDNDLTILDSLRATIGSVEDLIHSMERKAEDWQKPTLPGDPSTQNGDSHDS